MSCGCCQITLLILLCVTLGLLVGVQIAHEYNIHGVQDMWTKFVDLFHKESSKIQANFANNN